MSHGSLVSTLTAIAEGDVLRARPVPGGIGPLPSANVPNAGAVSPAGHLWTARAIGFLLWESICYGNGLFVAVANNGGTVQVNTSPDGITWTGRTTVGAVSIGWQGICFGNGLFVAVAQTGSSFVMTSPDGITWTARTAATTTQWQSVCFGNGLFVAVSNSGTGNRVMTSPDGITWTSRTSAADNDWQSVCYGNGLFVAVAQAGTNRAMTSPDGITWTIRTFAQGARNVCYGNGLYVAVQPGGAQGVATSPDGITWTVRTTPAPLDWWAVCYGNGLFVVVMTSGITNRVATSPDGITWTSRTSAGNNNWLTACYGNGIFVAIGDGAGVMTSGKDPVTVLSMGLADSGALLTVPTNGGSVTIPDRVMTYILDPAALIASFTLTMPAAPFHGQIVAIVGGSFGITALTLSPNTGQNFATGAAITALAASARAQYVFSKTNSRWYRFQ